MASTTTETAAGFLTNSAIPIVQNMFATNGHQAAGSSDAASNGNGFFQCSFAADANSALQNVVSQAANPNPGNYPSAANGGAAFGYNYGPNGFAVNAVAQNQVAAPQDSYATPSITSNDSQVQNPSQVQQTYAVYGNQPVNGVKALNPTMVNYGPDVQPGYAPQAQPFTGNNWMAYGDPNSWYIGSQQAYQTPGACAQNNWNSSVQNSDQTVAASSLTNAVQDCQNLLPPSGVDQVSLQHEWEAYQALLNQDKSKIKSDNQGPKDPGFSEGFVAAPYGNFFSTSGLANGGNFYTPQLSGGVYPWGFSGSINVARGGNGPSIPSSQVNGFVFGASVNGYKTKLCTRYNSPEGCKYGDKCNFAHGEADLRVASTYLNGQQGTQIMQVVKQPVLQGNSGTPLTSQPLSSTMIYYGEPSPPGVTATMTIGATSLSKLAIDAAYVGAIIGKAGSNVKQINRATGCKVSISEHESNPQMRCVQMEGSQEQIEKASEMIKQLLQQKDAGATRANMVDIRNYKTRLCENFNAGACSYGDRCHFAHGVHELRSVVG